MSLKGDGTQSFTCSVPKYYINPETNQKITNPRWEDINNGVLAENTRVLKVFLQTDTEIKIYPFIIDKITDKRDSHFSVYREIEASGLAFSDLGKVGYKLELNSNTLETDYEKDNTVVATIDYWLDKVFPNEKDKNGKIIKWLTPWCYEIRMDWSIYTESRDSTKIYEDSYISSWAVENDELIAAEVTEGIEKARYIDCSNSNKYNITQTLAETYGVFCDYEYKCAENGKFISEYVDENGNIWRGKKVVFYNRAIKSDNPFMLTYEDNLDTISRTSDSSEIYTKLFITPIQSEVMENGYVSIADTTINPLQDDFILNFDYLYNIGALSEYQKNFISSYQTQIHNINQNLIELAPIVDNLTVQINNVKSEIATCEKEIASSQESLQDYQTLRDNEATNEPVIKNASNACSVVFTTADGISQANIRLQGVATATIVGYTDYKYTTAIFGAGTSSPLKVVNNIGTILAGDRNTYVVLDDYGYPKLLYTAADNTYLSDGTGIIYLALTYSPKNAYESICNSLQNIIQIKTAKIENLTQKQEQLQLQLDNVIEQQKALLSTKDEWNQKLELYLGPALREGYWTPESYEDPGQGKEADLIVKTSWDKIGAQLILDDELFDGEETGYYYDSIDDVSSDKKTYYPFLDVSAIYGTWHDQDMSNLVIHLQNPGFRYTVVNNALAAGRYYVIYNGKQMYFTLSNSVAVGALMELKIDNNVLTLFINNVKITALSETPISGAANLTTIFEGINNYLGERLIYNDAGFIFSFIKTNEKIIPVLLFNNTAIEYSRYSDIAYSFSDGNIVTFAKNSNIVYDTEFTILYPRIAIYDDNVNYESDNLTIQNYPNAKNYDEENATLLEKYTDYSVLIRNGKPFFTLRFNNINDFYTILNYGYRINYQVSRANEMLYLDAKEVAFDNSQPKYSYSVKVSNIPDNIRFMELGQLVYINDHALGVHAATGYINEIKYNLDEPQSDEVTVQNYKTKFEDLFSTITASSEAMKNNATAYDIAAGGFTPKGELEGAVLQQALNNNNVVFNFANTKVNIDDTNGILLTNLTAYTNGIYGQVALQGGGIFLSSSVDSTGARIWSTGITPNGINASVITSGRLDTDLIRIFAGNNLAFQWNGEGIFAYRRNDDGTTNLNSYVRYSDQGLQYILDEENDSAAVSLGWDGLFLSAQNGSLSLTGGEGLVIYEGQKNEAGSNHVVRLGRILNDNLEYEYGLRLYKKDENGDYIENLIMSNNGELWLKDELAIGTEEQDENGNYNLSGITGNKNKESNSTSVRFWAGARSKDKVNAPFQVWQDGTLIAKRGQIGSLVIDDITDSISSSIITFLLESSVNEIFTTETETTLNISVSGQFSNINDYSIIWQKKNGDMWEDLDVSGTQISIELSNGLSIRVKAKKDTYTYFSNTLTFTQLEVSSTEYSFECPVAAVSRKLIGGFFPEQLLLGLYCNGEKLSFAAPNAEAKIDIPIAGEEISVRCFISEENEKEEIDLTGIWNLYTTVSESGETITDNTIITLPLENIMITNATKAVFIQAYKGTTLVAYYELPVILDEELATLAKIQDGKVIISDGAVIATSIASNAITTYHLAAGSVVAETIAANAISTEHLLSNSLKSLDKLIYEDETNTYTSSGAIIDLSKSGAISFKNFYIDEQGNAGFRGTVVAQDGEIAGWVITDEYIAKTDENNNFLVGLYSGTNIQLNGSPYRFFAGGKNSTERNFIVSEDGQLVAKQASIEGNIIAKDGYIENLFYVGADQGIILNGHSAQISSSNYVADANGWMIDKYGNAEFNNLSARGKFSSVIFETNKISAISGSLYIAPSIVFNEDVIVENGIFTIVGDANTNWQINSEVILNCVSDNQVYDNISAIVTGFDDTTITFQVTDSALLNATLQAGGNVILIGDDTSKKYIYLNANHTNGPFIDVQNYISSDSKDTLPQVRVGNLSGIIDEYFSETNLEGYGLYSQNAYLRGQMVLPKVGITNQDKVGYSGTGIYENTTDNGGNAIRIWAGGDNPEIGSIAAPFIITQDGSLYASKGVFSGIVEASGGYFSGAIKTAGVVIDNSSTGVLEAPYSHFYVGYREDKDNDLNENDYIINIDQNGLSIYESGLSAYSDYASGWQNGILTSHTLSPYNYNEDRNKNPMPYFYLIDDAILDVNDEIEQLLSRWVSVGGHIFNIQNLGNNQYSFNSVILNNGIFFNTGTFESNTDNIKAQEEICYSDTSMGIRAETNSSNQSYLNIISDKFFGINLSSSQLLEADTTINGSVQITNIDNPIENTLKMGQQTIREAFYNGTSCGFDIITI